LSCHHSIISGGLNGTIPKEIQEARRKKIIVRMLCVYADDSTDGNKERVFAVAGVMGTQEEWDVLEVKWLERTGGIPFHTTDCEAGWGKYRDVPQEERRLLYRDLMVLLTSSNLSGYGSVVDLQSYLEVFGHDSPTIPYIFCFVTTVAHLVKWTRLIIPKQEVKFTFDTNPEMQFNAGFIYNEYLIKHPEYKDAASQMTKEISFASSETVGIQVADLFSFETMKRLSNILAGRGRRLSYVALENTRRFQVQCFFKRDLELLRNHYGEQRIEKFNKEYVQWLSTNNRQHNLESQIRYLIHLDNIKKLRGEI